MYPGFIIERFDCVSSQLAGKDVGNSSTAIQFALQG